MARWTVTPGTVGNTMSSKIDYDDNGSQWEVYQDEKPFIDAVKEEQAAGNKANVLGAKKFATIPDIVAIEVWEKYGINIHDPNIMGDKVEMNKFKQIIMRDYPYLVVNKA